MLNKVVKVSDYHLLQFFYPHLKVRTELSLLDRDNSVLYVGKVKPKLKQWLSENTKEFISTVGPVEEDLTNTENLVRFVYQSRGKNPSQRVLDQVKVMELSDVEYLCKVYWVSGCWLMGSQETDKTVYSLFQASVSTLQDLLITYFELRKEYPYEILEASFLTFLSRVSSIEDQSVSSGYMKLLRQAHQKFGVKIKPLVFRLGASEDTELSFINLLLDLR